jgi:(p)ppGpp synthase/HD superfamily hydrolase
MEKEYVEFIDKYYEQAETVYDGMFRKTGEEYIYHPINVAYILAI